MTTDEIIQQLHAIQTAAAQNQEAWLGAVLAYSKGIAELIEQLEATQAPTRPVAPVEERFAFGGQAVAKRPLIKKQETP